MTEGAAAVEHNTNISDEECQNERRKRKVGGEGGKGRE